MEHRLPPWGQDHRAMAHQLSPWGQDLWAIARQFSPYETRSLSYATPARTIKIGFPISGTPALIVGTGYPSYGTPTFPMRTGSWSYCFPWGKDPSYGTPAFTIGTGFPRYGTSALILRAGSLSYVFFFYRHLNFLCWGIQISDFVSNLIWRYSTCIWISSICDMNVAGTILFSSWTENEDTILLKLWSEPKQSSSSKFQDANRAMIEEKALNLTANHRKALRVSNFSDHK